MSKVIGQTRFDELIDHCKEKTILIKTKNIFMIYDRMQFRLLTKWDDPNFCLKNPQNAKRYIDKILG